MAESRRSIPKLYIILGVLALAVIGYVVYGQMPGRQSQGFYARDAQHADRIVCASKDAGAQSLCKVLQFRTLPNLGTHNDLWVLFDALHVIARANPPDGVRGQVDAVYTELNAALSEDGVLAVVARDLSTEPQDGAYRDANTLYYATVAQYPRCTALVGAPDCRSGLPVPVVTALGKAAALVAADGPKVAPYEFGLRKPAVDAFLASGLAARG